MEGEIGRRKRSDPLVEGRALGIEGMKEVGWMDSVEDERWMNSVQTEGRGLEMGGVEGVERWMNYVQVMKGRCLGNGQMRLHAH